MEVAALYQRKATGSHLVIPLEDGRLLPFLDIRHNYGHPLDDAFGSTVDEARALLFTTTELLLPTYQENEKKTSVLPY